MTMSTNTDALGHVVEKVPEELRDIRSWAERALSTEGLKELGLIVATVIVWGVIFLSLHHALDSYTITGF
jgi:hypothetical protein